MRNARSSDVAQPECVERAARVRAKSNRNPQFEADLGARIRSARLAAGLNLAAVGDALGISYQQVLKYEKGQDRVAASTLVGIATALGVHPGFFFDDVPVPSGGSVKLNGILRASKALQRVRSRAALQRIVALIEAIAGAEHDEAHAEDSAVER